VLISNHVNDTQEALDLYRAKGVVEKSFFQYKNNLGFHRFRVHSDERAQNKIFVAFIALIISSHIHGSGVRSNLFLGNEIENEIKGTINS